MISFIREEDAPADLLPRIMARIEPKRLSRPKRFLRWIMRPRTVSVRPVFAAPVAAAALALLLLAVWTPREQENASQLLNGRQEVVFFLEQPKAGSVSLIGSFNGWSAQGYEMSYEPSRGVWHITVPLPPGAYAYSFLVDGRLVADPSATLQQDDGFGNQNSLLLVGGNHEHAI